MVSELCGCIRNFNIENLPDTVVLECRGPHHVRTSEIFLKLFQTGISHRTSARVGTVRATRWF